MLTSETKHCNILQPQNQQIINNWGEATEKEIFRNQGYWHTNEVERACYEELMSNKQATKELIYFYHYGRRFMHVEAYSLCGLSKIWPDFCRHKDNRNYILVFSKIGLSNDEVAVDLHRKFEEWFKEFRKIVSRKASDNLGFKWDEIK